MAAHHHDHQLLDEISPRKDNITMASSSSLCYSNVVSHPLAVTHLQSFDSNPEIYDLDNSGIQMIGFQPNPQNIHHHHEQNQFLMVTSQEQQQRQQQQLSFMDDSSTKPCVFPCEENNERPSQGLSLSLSSSNPSTISLQSIELRHHHNHTQRLSLSLPLSNSRDGFLDKSESFHHQPQQEYQDLFAKIIMGGCGSTTSSSIMNLELMKNSKYMGPAQDLLNEFCNLRSRQNPDYPKGKKLQLSKNKENLVDDDSITNNNNYNNASSSSTKDANSSLYDINLLDLHKRNTKLTCMLEELDRRYKHYCEQMKVVVSSFDAVVGPGSANVYSDLASKAMSMHFRCLRDTILAQIKATKKTIVEKDPSNASVLETTKGETPRLRILDQNLKKKRAYQQITMLENHPWRPQRGLPEHSVSVLRAWLFEHFLHPYPSDVDKHILARQTGLTRGQVSNWFINARVRLWKPMVEQMYLAETKEEQDTMGPTSDADYNHPSSGHLCGGFMQPPPPHLKQDPDQLTRFDPDPLSSIVNTNTMASTSRTDPSNMTSVLRSQQSGQFIDGFGSVYHLDFPSSSHNQQHHTSNYGVTTQNDNNTPRKGFAGGNGGGNNVSLTLGLQQLSGNGVSLAFSPTSRTTSLLYPRDHIEDCQQVHQYSLLDGD